MELTRIDTSHYNGQAQCTRCKEKGKFNIGWSCMMIKFKEIDGIYCSECVKEILNNVII